MGPVTETTRSLETTVVLDTVHLIHVLTPSHPDRDQGTRSRDGDGRTERKVHLRGRVSAGLSSGEAGLWSDSVPRSRVERKGSVLVLVGCAVVDSVFSLSRHSHLFYFLWSVDEIFDAYKN